MPHLGRGEVGHTAHGRAAALDLGVCQSRTGGKPTYPIPQLEREWKRAAPDGNGLFRGERGLGEFVLVDSVLRGVSGAQ